MTRFDTIRLFFMQRRFVAALCLNLLFLLLCLGMGGVHFGSLDDFFMSAVVTGAYGGEFDPHTLFVNGVYAFFLRPFYGIYSTLNWYFIFELLSTFASFTVFIYFMLRQVSGKLGLALSAFLLACLAPDFYMQASFTQCAAAATAAAILLFYFGNGERRRAWIVLGGLFFIMGIVFRKEGFLLGIPFLVTILALNASETRKIMKATIVVFMICVCAYQVLLRFNNSLFENDGYSYYREYQWCRAIFGDGDNYDVDATYDELEERQMQGRDFKMLRSWIFYDTEVFSLDSLKQIASVVQRNRYEVNPVKMPAALFLVVSKSFFKANAWCWIVISFIFFFFIPKRANWYTWGSLTLLCLCMSYLLYVNRMVYHVESGIWLYAIVCAIPLMRKECFENNQYVGKMPFLMGLMALGSLVLALSNQRNIDNNRVFFGTPQMSKEWEDFNQYMLAHPDDVFLLYFNDYKYLATYRNPPYKAVAPGSWGNIIPLGYWNMNLPGMQKEMMIRGVQNPIGDLIKDNVFVLETDTLHRFGRFYKVHYHDSVVIQPVKEFGDLRLVKYRSEGGAR